MAEIKTKQTNASVREFLDRIPDEQARKDSHAIARLMSKVTGAPPKMWGPSIVGFGSYRYRYPNGREMDWMLAGFSPRKQNLTLYIMTGLAPHGALMKKLGKYTTGQSCLYIKRLEDIDIVTLEQILTESVRFKSVESDGRGYVTADESPSPKKVAKKAASKTATRAARSRRGT